MGTSLPYFTQNLDRLGLLTDRMIAVHMVHLTPEEVSICAKRGVSVVHCLHSNMKLASGAFVTCGGSLVYIHPVFLAGFARVADLLAAGVNVAIGTDSCASNNCLDMFSEMKVAANMAKAVSDDPTAVPAPTVSSCSLWWV